MNNFFKKIILFCSVLSAAHHVTASEQTHAAQNSNKKYWIAAGIGAVAIVGGVVVWKKFSRPSPMDEAYALFMASPKFRPMLARDMEFPENETYSVVATKLAILGCAAQVTVKGEDREDMRIKASSIRPVHGGKYVSKEHVESGVTFTVLGEDVIVEAQVPHGTELTIHAAPPHVCPRIDIRDIHGFMDVRGLGQTIYVNGAKNSMRIENSTGKNQVTFSDRVPETRFC